MKQNLKLITMCDVETEQVNFLWKPYIVYGKITIVQDDPGDGKTTMMLAKEWHIEKICDFCAKERYVLLFSHNLKHSTSFVHCSD